MIFVALSGGVSCFWVIVPASNSVLPSNSHTAGPFFGLSWINVENWGIRHWNPHGCANITLPCTKSQPRKCWCRIIYVGVRHTLVSGQICWCLISPHRNTTSETWKKRVTDINSSWSLQNYRDRARRWGIQVPRWWGTQIMWDVVVLCALGNKPLGQLHVQIHDQPTKLFET